jgi:hypothetical protein
MFLLIFLQLARLQKESHLGTSNLSFLSNSLQILHLIFGLNGTVSKFALRVGESSFRDITCSSCFKFIFETLKIERRIKGIQGKWKRTMR